MAPSARVVVALALLGVCAKAGVRFNRSAALAERSDPFRQRPDRPATRVLVVSDSTAVGTGAVDPRASIAGRIAQDHPDVEIVNLGADGARLADVLEQIRASGDVPFDLVLVQAGGNDVIRLASAPRLEADCAAVAGGGRVFESLRPDQNQALGREQKIDCLELRRNIRDTNPLDPRFLARARLQSWRVLNSWFLVEILSSLAAIEAANDQYSRSSICGPQLSRRPEETGRGALAPDFRLLVLRGGDRSVERGAQPLGGVQGQFDPGARSRVEAGVDEVECDDVAERHVTRVVVGDHAVRERKPGVAALGHAVRRRDLDDGCAHVPSPYFPRCLPKKASTLLQPSMAASGRYSGRCQYQMPWPAPS